MKNIFKAGIAVAAVGAIAGIGYLAYRGYKSMKADLESCTFDCDGEGCECETCNDCECDCACHEQGAVEEPVKEAVETAEEKPAE